MRWWRRRFDPCAAALSRLTIPHPFDLGSFSEGIAEQRGRPLLLLPLEGPPDPELPCGMWIGLDEADLVFYDASAADFLKVHIVLHEIAHMLLGHVAPELQAADGPCDSDLSIASEHFESLLARTDSAVRGLDRLELPVAAVMRAEAARIRAISVQARPIDQEIGLDAERIVAILGRSKFASRQEKEAETLATLILERASRNETQSTSDQATDVLTRLHDAFGHPVRK